MKASIAIITEDILFWNLFVPLLNKKKPELSVLVCGNYDEINNLIVPSACKLILIDGGNSRLSSIDVIHYLRTSKHVLKPIWFFPEIMTDAYKNKSITLGATKIIHKPFDPYLVVDEIISLLF